MKYSADPTAVMTFWFMQMTAEAVDNEEAGDPVDTDLWDAAGFLGQLLEAEVTE